MVAGFFSSPASKTWVLAGDLDEIASLGGQGAQLRTIEECIDPGANAASQADDTVVLLVGGLGGVYRTLNPTGNAPLWGEYGSGMPNVLVTDLHYDRTDDVLLAGTFGRGAWTIARASETLAHESVLLLRGLPAVNDAFRLQCNPDNPSQLDAFIWVDGAAMPKAEVK